MKKFFGVCGLVSLATILVAAPVLGASIFRPYFLARDIEPQVYIAGDVYFLEPWGSNTPSTSYVDICTFRGAKHVGRLVKISDYEMALSTGYSVKKSGERVENQVVVAKKDIMMVRIYW